MKRIKKAYSQSLMKKIKPKKKISNKNNPPKKVTPSKSDTPRKWHVQKVTPPECDIPENDKGLKVTFLISGDPRKVAKLRKFQP